MANIENLLKIRNDLFEKRRELHLKLKEAESEADSLKGKIKGMGHSIRSADIALGRQIIEEC